MIRHVGSLEVQRDLLALVCRQGSCSIKGILKPAFVNIGIVVTPFIQGAKGVGSRSWLQAAGKVIKALIRCLIGIDPQPVSHGDCFIAGRDGKGLPDVISAAGIPTQVGAITPRMRVQIFDQLIVARGEFPPGRLSFLKSTILY